LFVIAFFTFSLPQTVRVPHPWFLRLGLHGRCPVCLSLFLLQCRARFYAGRDTPLLQLVA
jgi:hypothetical protein